MLEHYSIRISQQLAPREFSIKKMTLKNGTLSVLPQIPFSFASQGQFASAAHQDSPIEESLQQDVTGTR